MVQKVELWKSNGGGVFVTEYEATVDELRDLLIDCGAVDTTVSGFLEMVVTPVDKLRDFVDLIQRVHAQHPTRPTNPLDEFRHNIPRPDRPHFGDPVDIKTPPPVYPPNWQSVEQKYGV